MNRHNRLIAVGLLLAVIFAACTPSTSPSTTPSSGGQGKTVTVFAASSLTDAFKEIADLFKKSHPGVTVALNFGGSSTLVAQLKDGAAADVFASANTKQMEQARLTGRINPQQLIFATNKLVIAVPASNPAAIKSPQDLSKSGIKFIIAAKNVPVREYTDTVLDNLAKTYGADYKDAVMKNVVSEEDNVRQIVGKLALGEADAGIVYQSDITPENAAKLTVIPIPDGANITASYPIALTNNPADTNLARAFIDEVLSAEGQAVLLKWNFIPVLVSAQNTAATDTATDDATDSATQAP